MTKAFQDVFQLYQTNAETVPSAETLAAIYSVSLLRKCDRQGMSYIIFVRAYMSVQSIDVNYDKQFFLHYTSQFYLFDNLEIPKVNKP